MAVIKVGYLYRVGHGVVGGGAVIRITNCERVAYGKRYWFETVSGESGIYRFFDEDSLFGKALIPVQEMIVICRKGNKVIALDKATGKKGVARCNPEDTFNFETGAKLAFKRLVGEDEPVKPEEPKFEVGEFVRVVGKSHGHGFPIGQVVKIVKILPDDHIECLGVCRNSRGEYANLTQVVDSDSLEKLDKEG